MVNCQQMSWENHWIRYQSVLGTAKRIVPVCHTYATVNSEAVVIIALHMVSHTLHAYAAQIKRKYGGIPKPFPRVY